MINELDQMFRPYVAQEMIDEVRLRLRAEKRWGNVVLPKGLKETVEEHVDNLPVILNEWVDLFPMLPEQVDINKVKKQFGVHDDPEAVDGDLSYAHPKHKELNGRKKRKEHLIFVTFLPKIIPDPVRNAELISVYNEYEQRKTKESKCANLIDKFEAVWWAEIHNCMDKLNPKAMELTRYLAQDFTESLDEPLRTPMGIYLTRKLTF
ncbi:HD domain-containing protein [Candidatus Gottesmanbacteria bacterium]|nr:HD domain-containing protein [Candidatus Gottesmanbacteria bacterium]